VVRQEERARVCRECRDRASFERACDGGRSEQCGWRRDLRHDDDVGMRRHRPSGEDALDPHAPGPNGPIHAALLQPRDDTGSVEVRHHPKRIEASREHEVEDLNTKGTTSIQAIEVESPMLVGGAVPGIRDARGPCANVVKSDR
jgi:hypothetical protein